MPLGRRQNDAHLDARPLAFGSAVRNV